MVKFCPFHLHPKKIHVSQRPKTPGIAEGEFPGYSLGIPKVPEWQTPGILGFCGGCSTVPQLQTDV